MNSKQKGNRGEREGARFIIEQGFQAERGVQYQGSPDSPDIRIKDLPKLHVECKRTERLKLYDALQQAKCDAGDEKIPVVLHRRNHHEWVVILDGVDFFNIIRESELVK